MKQQGRKVFVSAVEVALFNSKWPGSELRPTRSYWFEFGANGDLVDHDIPQHDDGSAAAAMADDCRDYIMAGKIPEWSVK
jgi:hypothetical protein